MSYLNCFHCYNRLCHFTTYYGEKYYGLLVQAMDDHNRHFIIPTYHKNYPDIAENILKKWKEEENSNSNSQVLERYGYEITENKVIVQCEGGQPGRANPYQNIEGSTGWRSGEVEATRLFIFGAGASFGMSYDTTFSSSKFRPPLVTQLFDERFQDIYKAYPAVVNSISVLRFQNNIEQHFQNEWNNISKAYKPNLLRDHINFQYYLQNLFSIVSEKNRNHEANLYDVLFEQVISSLPKNGRIVVVNFNYDTFIEQSLERIWNQSFFNIDDYVDDKRQVNLFKPHGSCNWGWRFRTDILGGNPSEWLYRRNITLDKIYFELLGSEIEMVRTGYGQLLLNKSKIQIVRSDEPHYPAMFIPYTDKDDFVLPFKHYNILTDYLSKITDMYLIGWKGNELMFNKLLKSYAHRLERVTIVNPLEKQNQEVSKNILPYIKNKVEIVVKDDFKDFVQGMVSV